MIEEIVSLKEKGYSLRKIAFKLNTTVGKVHYRLKKYNETKQIESRITKSVFSLSSEIPARYDHNHISALVQNPHCIYAFWEVDANMQNMIAHHLTTGWPEVRKQLRIYDVSDLNFNGHDAHQYYEISLPEMTNNWFIRNVGPNRTYIIDYGARTSEGSFLTMLRSQPVETPRKNEDKTARHHQPVLDWKTGKRSVPDWHEHFSTYSYYQKLKQ
ncbi:DUF4912 domain-containing protein [Alkalihalobacillus sp. AL-G]|uniref:DUF4912 domain-containing protein n=1 Tax=Alkalihalobacillus sp. AL-G TaxID=2926399 RepID=UPI00272A5040|nr:DUF4912 domain-containing protein [Alkalihalobacillus sp. AL-G]WLD92074.1 DUF4912 domain-containing protein [Alkalihalobacillus sp. AL-G]